MSRQWEDLIQKLVRSGILRSPNVIEALRRVPREPFLQEPVKSSAATDCPLPIGSGQTASAPHMVSIMDEALELEVGHKVLEVGGGSGWHASTIAEIVAPSDISKESWGHVYTIERIAELAAFAKQNIIEAGYGDRVTVIHQDGTVGYPEEAPYDRILVAAAGPTVPKPLINQLKDGGVLLVPVGGAQHYQNLVRVRKKGETIIQENLGGVAFVPLIGKHGFQE
ncbi:MAG: protein-L-isoaspartate(D-aspartate) O-methyltransferase [Candidatus Bathyarchaeota archaeon]|nr:protein-L-isoaspartate(D-aspartate) O-methyltransferase [Candidatus Bathyarchaeum sp.]